MSNHRRRELATARSAGAKRTGSVTGGDGVLDLVHRAACSR
ncbi:hypothetical protein [Nocardioides sp. Soil796]|nr:hypothetical protein [Nocardioides sp. Soil796]